MLELRGGAAFFTIAPGGRDPPSKPRLRRWRLLSRRPVRRWIVALLLPLIWSFATIAAPAPQEEPITSRIPRERVESSVICEIGYSKRQHWLELKFVNGGIYRYLDVPPSVYRELLAADSKASYYARYIRNNYRSLRVRSRGNDEPAQ
jgi:KTSC domain